MEFMGAIAEFPGTEEWMVLQEPATRPAGRDALRVVGFDGYHDWRQIRARCHREFSAQRQRRLHRPWIRNARPNLLIALQGVGQFADHYTHKAYVAEGRETRGGLSFHERADTRRIHLVDFGRPGRSCRLPLETRWNELADKIEESLGRYR